jgi:hypothetical protein
LKAALGLTLLVAGVYLFTASGHLDGQDQEYYFRMARAIAHERTFAIEPLVFQNTEIAGRRGRDGQFYAEYAPALPMAIAPLIAFADLFQSSGANLESNYHWLRDKEHDVLERIFASYFNIAIVAATAGALVLLVMRLGYSEPTAVYVGAAFALSTFAWGQARIINPEPLQTLLIVISVLMTLASTEKRAFVGGCAIGCAALTKLTSVLTVPSLLILPSHRATTFRPKVVTGAMVIFPLLCALSVYAFYNYARFGSLLATGYNISGRAAELGGNGIGNPLIGFCGLLFSTGRGLIWYAPPVLGAALGYARFFREKKIAAIALALLASVWIAFHSFYQGWDSGWGWGPRYLLPILPFILVPTAEALKGHAGRIICVTLAILGFLIQIPGALVDFMASGQAGLKLFGETAHERSAETFVTWRNFHINGSEIVRHFSLLKEGQVDVAWITFRESWLPAVTFCLVIILILSGTLLIISTLRAQRPLEHSPRKV